MQGLRLRPDCIALSTGSRQQPSRSSRQQSVIVRQHRQSQQVASRRGVHAVASVQAPRSQGLSVRGAAERDFWDLSVIHQEAFFPDAGFPFDDIQRVDRLLSLKLCALGRGGVPGQARYECLVAESPAGRALGTATIDNYGDRFPRSEWSQAPTTPPSRALRIAYVSNVAVSPDARRRGVASQLVKEAERVAASWGCRGVALHCLITEPGVQQLYRQLGYRQVTIDPFWKQIIEMRPARLVMFYRRLTPDERAAGAEAGAVARAAWVAEVSARARRLGGRQERGGGAAGGGGSGSGGSGSR